MKKKLAVLIMGIVFTFSMSTHAYAMHAHSWSHNFDGSTYQKQICTYSRVYEWLDGVPQYRPYVEYGIYYNCTQKCGCGQSRSCNTEHYIRTVGGWAY